MYTVYGKQRWGAVWHEGRCIAAFRRGLAVIDSETDARLLLGMGYQVDGLEAIEATEATEVADLSSMTVAELRAYAETNDIDLAGATRKADILAAVQAAQS